MKKNHVKKVAQGINTIVQTVCDGSVILPKTLRQDHLIYQILAITVSKILCPPLEDGEKLQYLEAMKEHLAKWGSIDDIKKEKGIKEEINKIRKKLHGNSPNRNNSIQDIPPESEGLEGEDT